MKLQATLEQIQLKECIIEIFGLGYVGFPLAIRLAKSGFKVIGIDKDVTKIERLKKNYLVEFELHLKNEFTESMKNGNFVLSTESRNIEKPKIAIICVPTPIPRQDIKSDVFVRTAIENFLNTSKAGDIIIIESSIEVGTTDKMKEIIESRNFKIGVDFGLCFCPERIDPQNKKWNLENIPRIIYCSDDVSLEISKFVYHNVNNSNLIRVSSSKIAEIVKSYENAYRLVNISLVNELAILCDKLGINIKEVIEAASTKPFGFMPFYPSAGAGGHCIPKDPTFLTRSAKKYDIEFSTIENALKINFFMPKYIVDSLDKTITELELSRTVLVCGLSYKPDIEDMRDSPSFRIIHELIKRGYKVGAYDPYYKHELRDRYLIENNIEGLDFKVIPSLDDELIRNFSCICVVQNHAKTIFRITEIYKNSLIPFVYDCQNQLPYDNNSKTILKKFGDGFLNT